MREREGSEGGLEQGGQEMSSFGFNRRSQIAGNEFPLSHVNFAPIVREMMSGNFIAQRSLTHCDFIHSAH